jgi:CSLREA domain-containing protein
VALNANGAGVLGQLTQITVGAGFVVNSLGDDFDADPGDGICETTRSGECTLRAAIEELNDPGGENPFFTDQTQKQTSGTPRIIFTGEASSGTIELLSDLPPIDETVIIDGPGVNQLTVVGISIFSINGATVTIQDLTLTEAGEGSGAAIVNFGRLALSNCSLEGFSADGIANYDTLTVRNCSFSEIQGGAIGNFEGTVDVRNSSFSDNFASDGGGIFNEGGSVAVDNCEFTNNSALNGGAIGNTSGSLTVNQSVFNNNIVNGFGGGAIFNEMGGTAEISNSQFSGNESLDGFGGAIYNPGGTLTLNNNRFGTAAGLAADNLIFGSEESNVDGFASGSDNVPETCNEGNC